MSTASSVPGPQRTAHICRSDAIGLLLGLARLGDARGVRAELVRQPLEAGLHLGHLFRDFPGRGVLPVAKRVRRRTVPFDHALDHAPRQFGVGFERGHDERPDRHGHDGEQLRPVALLEDDLPARPQSRSQIRERRFLLASDHSLRQRRVKERERLLQRIRVANHFVDRRAGNRLVAGGKARLDRGIRGCGLRKHRGGKSQRDNDQRRMDYWMAQGDIPYRVGDLLYFNGAVALVGRRTRPRSPKKRRACLSTSPCAPESSGRPRICPTFVPQQGRAAARQARPATAVASGPCCARSPAGSDGPAVLPCSPW